MVSLSVREVLGWEALAGGIGLALVLVGATVSGLGREDLRPALVATLLLACCVGWEVWTRRLALSLEREGNRVRIRRRGAIIEDLQPRQIAPAMVEVRLSGFAGGLLLVGAVSAIGLAGCMHRRDIVHSLYFAGGSVALIEIGTSILRKRWSCSQWEIPLEGETREIVLRREDARDLMND